MKNGNEKKGLFERLTGKKKVKKSSCCDFQIEELPEENDNKEPKDSSNSKKDSCCD